mgnify:CR=1 FL=1
MYISIDDQNIVDFVCNKRLKEILCLLIGPKVYFLHDTSVLDGPIYQTGAWHRDNPCRRFGYGPDWDKKIPYNVLRLGIYLQKFEETNSCINVIPGSHKKRFTFQEILRFFHELKKQKRR